MQIRNSSGRYGVVAQFLRWSIVVLIVVQFVLASQAANAGSLLQKARILTSHKSVGITILMLAVVRLLWRFANPVPDPPPGSKPWQKWARQRRSLGAIWTDHIHACCRVADVIGEKLPGELVWHLHPAGRGSNS